MAKCVSILIAARLLAAGKTVFNETQQILFFFLSHNHT